MTSPAQERIEKARLKVSQAQARLEALGFFQADLLALM